MQFEEKFKKVTVLGAAGKMGRGITLLAAVEMLDIVLESQNKNGLSITAFDISTEALAGLKQYLKIHSLKIAEKNIVQLRKYYENEESLIENSEIIQKYCEDILDIVNTTTSLSEVYNSDIIFEAAKEEAELKIKLFSDIKNNSDNSPWILTNTSSIPISVIDKNANLNGNIIGFHFYNPPPVQKLVELITTENTNSELIDFSKELSKRMRKTIVPANDKAGFIGNGHFMRDTLYAVSLLERLSKKYTFQEAVYIIERVSRDFLIRPMGIFQLVDYVGLDVCQKILAVMNPHFNNEDLHSKLIDNLISIGIYGGQNPDGSQRNGFLEYTKGRPSGIIDPVNKVYQNFSEFSKNIDNVIGSLPAPSPKWKNLIRDINKGKILEEYFSNLRKMDTPGAVIADEYGFYSKGIGEQLVESGVAKNSEDVNAVMVKGFHHAYGPINNYFDERD